MIATRNRRSIVPMLAVLSVSLGIVAWASESVDRFHEGWGSRYSARHKAQQNPVRAGLDAVHRSNEIAPFAIVRVVVLVLGIGVRLI